MRRAIVWTRPDCTICQQVKSLLSCACYDIDERSTTQLVDAVEPDVEAMTQLALQGMQVPIVKIYGLGFVEPVKLLREGLPNA